MTGWGRLLIGKRTISTHTPLAGRDVADLENNQNDMNISTHTPLAGRDVGSVGYSRPVSRFLLTRPLRDVTLMTSTSS